MPRHLILGTAGHIDHGKTALVHALTGTDTDRLPEEKRRGITIDLGFARLTLDDGTELGVVDVPGHEAFIRNMLAGATGIDMVLLVVAADESVMPQTREHIAIVELLGITHAVVALTKADLVEEAWLDLVRDEVRELLAHTALRHSPILPVSARTGAGLPELVDALARAAAAVSERQPDDLFRMPIDRVFTVRGTGTVVTGTVWSGSLARDATVSISPADLTARVRALQRHGTATDRVAAGERAAVALTGVDREQLDRGQMLLTGAGWEPAHVLTADLHLLADAPAPLRPRQRVRVHLGTAEVLARVGLLDQPLTPGGRTIAQLRLEQPLVARAGDRIVIRSYSPVYTIAGAVVLEPRAPKRKRLSAATRQLLTALGTAETVLPALLQLRGAEGVRAAELPVLTGRTTSQLQAQLAALPVAAVGDRVVLDSHLRACRDAIVRATRHFHAQYAMEEGIEKEPLRRTVAPDAPAHLFDCALEQLLAQAVIVSRSGTFALADHEPAANAEQQQRIDRLRALLSQSALEPPDIDELAPAAGGDPLSLLRFLERRGDVVRISQSRFADAHAIARAVAAVRSQMPLNKPLGVAEFKGVLNLSRKHLIPLLEYFDRAGITVRAGEQRRIVAPGTGAATPGAPHLETPRNA